MSLLVKGKKVTSVHLVGILGSGMSGIAQMLRWHGCSVSGSDRMSADPDCQRTHHALLELGCTIAPQDGSGVNSSIDALVVSSAIEKDNPDIVTAITQQIPILHRSDMLAALVQLYTTIAVAGTSGKSTVTALTFELLQHCGKSPSVVAGANVSMLVDKGYIGNAYKGEGNILVIEADESDGTLIKYHPAISLFLNVSRDHKPVEETTQLFQTLAQQSRVSIVNNDDPRCVTLKHQYSFGLSSGANLYPSQIVSLAPQVTAVIQNTEFSFAQIGEHNLYNLLAALSACIESGCTPDQLKEATASYQGIKRRFEIVGTAHGTTIIDDYAHNPEKITAAVKAAQTMSQRIIAIFQPHGFGPTKFMREELVHVFAQIPRSTDSLFLLPIYYVGGTAQKDISSESLAAEVRQIGGTIQTAINRENLIETLIPLIKPGDVILVMGARDPSLPSLCKEILHAINDNPQKC